MKIYIVIPAHNEEDYITKTLESLVNQQLKPAQVVVVNDNSTDRTAEIVNDLTQQYAWIQQVHKKSSEEHLPGAKIVEAFMKAMGYWMRIMTSSASTMQTWFSSQTIY